MSKKERDIWDDAIRSKLEDFEMDTLPGDWEAIADRLPERLGSFASYASLLGCRRRDLLIGRIGWYLFI